MNASSLCMCDVCDICDMSVKSWSFVHKFIYRFMASWLALCYILANSRCWVSIMMQLLLT